MNYDNEYEQELVDAIPLTQTELKEATLTYQGPYHF